MMADIPKPDVWLDSEMTRLDLNYNKLANLAGISPSSITEFRKGRSGPGVCTAIAQVLGVSPMWVMVVAGILPPPANMATVETDRLATIYLALDDTNKNALMAFAEFLRYRVVQERQERRQG